MTKRITLSPRSLALIAALKKGRVHSIKVFDHFNFKISRTVEYDKLIAWLSLDLAYRNEKEQILLASLNASLLKDLSRYLANYQKKKKNEEKLSWFNQIKSSLYSVLTAAGTIVFAFYGFDGITSIVTVFPVSMPILLVLGIFFAFISVLAFYAFDLTQISMNLKIDSKNARKLVDNYLYEVEQINSIRNRINKEYIRRKTIEELDEDLRLSQLLIARYKALDKGRELLTKKAEENKISITKYLITSLIGIIYFSFGFFAGQFVAVAIAGLFVASTASLFWPILLVSIGVGFAAFGVYWFVERPSIDQLVANWFGLNKKKIDRLCNPEKIENHKNKLEILRINLKARKALLAKHAGSDIDYTGKLDRARKKIIHLKKFNLSPKEIELGFFAKIKPGRKIILREKTKNLIEKLKEMVDKPTKFFKKNVNEKLNQATLLKWLHQAQVQTAQDEKAELLKASLNSALLKDIANSLYDPMFSEKPKKKKTNSRLNIYFFLGIAGTIFFGSEGFYNITSLLVSFSLPKIVVLLVGAVFGLIFIVAFLAFDLVEIAKNLGIKKKHDHSLVDIHLKEVEAIKAIRKSLNEQYSLRNSIEELEEDLKLAELIIQRYNKLDEDREKLVNRLADKKLTLLKYTVSSIIGVIYFTTGFFSGQAVALILAGFFVSTAAPFSWPIILISTLIGFAALMVYCYVERPSIEKLVSYLCGLDEDNIESFCNPEQVEKQKEKLEQLKTNLLSCKEYMGENSIKEIDNLQDNEKVVKLQTSRKTLSQSNFTLSTQSDYFFYTKENQPELLEPNSLKDLKLL